MDEHAENPVKNQRFKNFKKDKDNIFGAICLVVIVIIAIAVIAGKHKPVSTNKEPAYKAWLAYSDGSSWAVVNPASISVAFHVKNVGYASGQPNCTVQAEDGSDSYTGYNSAQMATTLRPGQTVTTAMPVTITHQGAQYITQATVSCS